MYPYYYYIFSVTTESGKPKFVSDVTDSKYMADIYPDAICSVNNYKTFNAATAAGLIEAERLSGEVYIDLPLLMSLDACTPGFTAFVKRFGANARVTAREVFVAIIEGCEEINWLTWLATRVDGFIEAVGNIAVENYHCVSSGELNVKNGYVLAGGDASVVATGKTRVDAFGNSNITASDDTYIKARDKSRVNASGNASVTACDNSHVNAFDIVYVFARDNSTVAASNKVYLEIQNESVTYTATGTVTVNHN